MVIALIEKYKKKIKLAICRLNKLIYHTCMSSKSGIQLKSWFIWTMCILSLHQLACLNAGPQDHSCSVGLLLLQGLLLISPVKWQKSESHYNTFGAMYVEHLYGKSLLLSLLHSGATLWHGSRKKYLKKIKHFFIKIHYITVKVLRLRLKISCNYIFMKLSHALLQLSFFTFCPLVHRATAILSWLKTG